MAFLKNCGICCGIFSSFAIIFLCVIGSVINSGSEVIDIAEADRSRAASNCFVGAGIYAGFAALSVICYIVGVKRASGGSLNDLRRMQLMNRHEQ
jgi:hypothetical protein